MDKRQLEMNKKQINDAPQIIVFLNSGKSYLYDGTRQIKLHEQNSWMFCENYSTNVEYLNHMYAIHMICKIELLYHNDYKTLYF